jgi:hypothetical protein
MTTCLSESLRQLDEALREPSPSRGWFLPIEDISRIDEAIEEASRRLEQKPAQLGRLLPSLRRLHRHRRACVRSLVDALAELPGPQLAARLTALASARAEDDGSGALATEPSGGLEPEAPSSWQPAVPEGSLPEEPALVAREDGLTESAEQNAAESAAELPLPVESGEQVIAETQPAEAARATGDSDAPSGPPGAAVDVAQIADFSRLFRARQHSRSVLTLAFPKVTTSTPVEVVREALEAIGPVPKTLTTPEAIVRRDRVQRLTRDLSAWQHLAAAQQLDLLTLVGAFSRALQERHGQEMGGVFVLLKVFSEREQPGFVHGLARKHTPRHGHWLEDARRAERSLRHWLGDDLKVGPAATSSQVTSSDPETDPESFAGPEASWPWWSCTRDRRAVLVGGSPRDSYQRRLQQVFGFASLDWVDGEVRRIRNLGRSIEHGGLDLVLIVRQFTSHKNSIKILEACKLRGVPFATIDHGHGVRGVQSAIERFLPAPNGSLARAVG